MTTTGTTNEPAAAPNGEPFGSCLRRLELEGLVVFENLLGASETAALRAQFEALPLDKPTANPTLSVYRDVHFSGCDRAVALLADPRMLGFLTRVLGDEIVCMSSTYARYDPGYPGMPLHTDIQPYGSKLFGPLASVPVSLRVFYFLDGLTAERSPLCYVPSSHLCLHAAANPYQQIRSHPEAIAVHCPAGSAVVINPRIFHAVGANRSGSVRSVYTVSYRPLWAGPQKRVPPHDRARLAALSETVRLLFRPPNTRRAADRLPLLDDGEMPPLGPRRWSDGGLPKARIGEEP